MNNPPALGKRKVTGMKISVNDGARQTWHHGSLSRAARTRAIRRQMTEAGMSQRAVPRRTDGRAPAPAESAPLPLRKFHQNLRSSGAI